MINIFRFILRNLGAILAAIELAETLGSTDLDGEGKKMIVLDAILDTAKKVGITPNRLTITILGNTIDTLVSVLNHIDWGEKIEGWLAGDVEPTLTARIKTEAGRVSH